MARMPGAAAVVAETRVPSAKRSASGTSVVRVRAASCQPATRRE